MLFGFICAKQQNGLSHVCSLSVELVEFILSPKRPKQDLRKTREPKPIVQGGAPKDAKPVTTVPKRTTNHSHRIRLQTKEIVQCSYSGTQITFRVDSGSNPNYFAVLIEFVGGDGSLSAVDLMQAGYGSWSSMQHSWGAVWMLNSGSTLQAPYPAYMDILLSLFPGYHIIGTSGTMQM
ncbi:Expansin-B15 [Carex littledalei]|uniref:Expansin-B15 n=1 Tax=Carex littledalei TaxID=544730 RepID=A0A833VU08_9POAL|nr:Expansin-B15 [Carex littledalei]